MSQPGINRADAKPNELVPQHSYLGLSKVNVYAALASTPRTDDSKRKVRRST
jgi:hypothetical protein